MPVPLPANIQRMVIRKYIPHISIIHKIAENFLYQKSFIFYDIWRIFPFPEVSDTYKLVIALIDLCFQLPGT